jgi:hypothetical protein
VATSLKITKMSHFNENHVMEVKLYPKSPYIRGNSWQTCSKLKYSIKIFKLQSLYKLRKENFIFLKKMWIFILVLDKLSFTRQTLRAKIHKTSYYVSKLEGVVHWLMAFGMKAQQINFYSWPIKLLESLSAQLTTIV